MQKSKYMDTIRIDAKERTQSWFRQQKLNRNTTKLSHF